MGNTNRIVESTTYTATPHPNGIMVTVESRGTRLVEAIIREGELAGHVGHFSQPWTSSTSFVIDEAQAERFMQDFQNALTVRASESNT